MEDAAPSLGVGFEIEYGGSIGALARIDAAMDVTHDRVLSGANDIERATGSMINTGRATAQIIAFGDATSREMRRASLEKKRLEDASERMIRQLDREAAALGKTRDELRDTRVEELALHAAKLGNLELADRLLASSRGRQAASDAAAEAAAEKKVAEERARVLEVTRRQAIAERELIAELRRQNDILAERANIEAALERTTGVGRVRAIDAGASYGALDRMMAEQEAAAARANARAMREQADAARAASAAERQLATDAQMLRSAMDPMYAAQVRFDDELQRAERLLAAGVFGHKEYAQSVQMSRDALYRHAQSVAGANAGAQQLEDANRRVGQSLTQLSFQGNDAITMLLSGSSAFQVVATQGGQVFQVFQQAQGGAKGLASELGTLAMRWAPLAGVVAVTVGPILAAAAAWHEYAGAIHEFEALAQGAGRAALLTAQDMESIAEGAARAGNVTVVAAREIETGYVRLGGIGKPVMQDLILLTRDFAAATGTDAAGATQTLGAAFQDPIKGAQDLATKFGALSQAQVEHIRQLVEQNDLYGAQAALLKGLEPAFDGAADHAGKLTLAWRSIRDAASEAWTEMGRAIDIALGGGSTLDKLQKAYQDKYRFEQRTLGGGNTKPYDDEIARLKAQLEREKAATSNAQARSRASGTMSIVDNVTGAGGLNEMRVNLGRINGLLKDNGVAAGLSADQLARARSAQAQYSNAVRTFIPEGERQVQLARLDVALARAKDAKDGKRVASLTAQRTELQNRGKLITAAQSQELATAASTRATLESGNGADRHAQQLQNEAKAMAVQIANTYKLVDAYGVSGGAALIAEAQVKAESSAIKKRGDTAAAVARQIQLAVAERIAQAARSSAVMQDEARIQTEVNAMLADGNVTAERAAQIVQERIAALPLLAAQEAAQQKGLKTEADRATKALEDQKRAQDAARGAELGKRFFEQDRAATDRIGDLKAELALIGQTDAARSLAMVRRRAEREAAATYPPGFFRDRQVENAVEIAKGEEQVRLQAKALNDELEHQGLLFDTIATNAGNAARGMSEAFGEAGRALGDMGAIFTSHISDQQRLTAARDAELRSLSDITDEQLKARRTTQINDLFNRRSSAMQIGFYGDMTTAAKGFFDEKSKGFAVLSVAEKAFRAVEFAMSVRAVAQDAVETGAKIATSVARTAAKATEAVITAISTLPFPANIAAGAATAAAIAAMGVSVVGSFGGSSRNRLDKANDGSGTVLGDTKAQSESVKRAIDQLREVDTLTNSFAREMAASLRSIDSQIGGVATAVVRAGDMGPNVREGFQSDATGSLLKGATTGWGIASKIPVIGGILNGIGSVLGSLFGASTSVIASGLSAKSQTVGSIMTGGFDASTYADVEKKKKFLGITTGKSYSTKYGDADADLEKQFTLLLGSFASAIGAAAGPLGESTAAVEARLSSFVVDIGKIDLKGLTGEQIAEKLTAVFGAAADKMADAAFPGIDRFQKVGEGAFETLVRVASTVEAVTVSLDQLGMSARALGIDAKMGIADQFDSLAAMSSAADAYFKSFYTPAEQNAARMRQLDGVFVRMGTTMPATIGAFRSLVEAQDLTTAAGQATYATLLQIAPAFAELKAAMDGAKSAADVLAEREGLQRRLLELNGDTPAIRALELAKLDASNRALQQQIYAIEDAKEAARAADDLRQAWKSVGDSLLDEVKRIRGLDTAGGGSFATMLGAFNAAITSARGGDIDAAKSLPGLSQALLKAAAEQATSRQELARIEAQTAASLEATQAAIAGRSAAATNAAILAASATAAAANQPAANDTAASMASQLEALRQEVAGMRSDNNTGHAATASAAGRSAKVLEAVTADSGGDAISVAQAA
ncbi:phage tail length tape measure family protein [Sphingomonas sp. Leaf62]|uniref:phage tail length tape measure family protein n=1 Tax=Sphingomonas sp. Leaf62 TaxID=1736228 RepID=UPI0006F8F166|nr:phage tail length tape measure family protein [Sphingomonas sp. Leaf62]KQN77881.1 hypothetical protein ASE91_14280 [Sphingomonas sp. Leaf62]